MNPAHEARPDHPAERGLPIKEALGVVIPLLVMGALVLIEEKLREIVKEALGWPHLLWILGLLGILLTLTFGCTWLWKKIYADDVLKGAFYKVESTLAAMGNLSAIITTLQKSKFEDLWLSRPWDYVEFVKLADERYALESSRHIETITLYGTMVGFAFLLPDAIRNHACRAGKEFRTLRLIASDALTKVGPDASYRELLHYPLYLVARLVEESFAKCQRFPRALSGGSEFDIEILYAPHDLISAAILLGNKEVATLQALDSRTFEDVLGLKQFQPGFKYSNDAGRSDAFDRHKTALEQMAQSIAASKRVERWEFRASGNSTTLSVSKPHWTYSKKNGVALMSSQEYDPSSHSYAFKGNQEIVKFVKRLLDHTRNSGGSAVDIVHIETLVGSLKWQDWPSECPCRFKTPLPIS